MPRKCLPSLPSQDSLPVFIDEVYDSEEEDQESIETESIEVPPKQVQFEPEIEQQETPAVPIDVLHRFIGHCLPLDYFMDAEYEDEWLNAFSNGKTVDALIFMCPTYRGMNRH